MIKYAKHFEELKLYYVDHKKAFENAKLKGLNDPYNYMYMYSKDQKDYFKNIMTRQYINFEQGPLND